MSSFESALLHCPEKGMEQADIGLKHMRDLSAVMLKVASMEDDHTQRVNKLVSEALAKMHSSGEARDGMATVHQAVMGTLTSMVQLNKHRSDLARRIAEQVGEPLDRFHKNGVSRLKMLTKREKEERLLLENQKSAVSKQKSQCMRLYEQSQTGAPDFAGHDKPSRLFKLAGTLGARALTVSEATEKLDTATSLYDEMLESASILQERYFNVCLPEVLSALECLELDRGAILINQLKIASSEVQILSENTQKEAIQLQSLCDRIDIARDLTQFVQDIISIPDQILHTRKKSVFLFDLPVSPPDSVFRKSLDDLINSNNGNAPVLLKQLIRRLRDLNAFTNVEGIFRVSPDKSQIAALKRQIESSESIQATLQTVESAHLLAVVLKEWLRGLPQPLIPNEHYDEVLKIGAQSGSEQQLTLSRLWQKLLSRSSKIVLIELKGVVDEVVANAEATKMNMYNICVCLSPSLVRTPESIPASIVMSNSKLEVTFAAALFTSSLSL